ncbi:hypothetical protein D9V37_08285 [Nocardioides mangrovicus]|uniref:Uncharacterized protein n=1 Tax=Nocardioides mangrovicus TaxID=2478913 RepID=A0A3L8P3N8_9ACTN|nr:hypothetical protein [Nocardioides mangrovicus]RLV49875.1 hypothetical protein D9V37_08285 [Nocardioides mangrovicus]
MRRPHQLVATVLVEPAALRDLELELMSSDLWVWPVATSAVSVDGERHAFQVRHRMVEAKRGEWDCAAAWTPVFVAFGASWYDGEEPLPWAAHVALWQVLAEHADRVRHGKRLIGVPHLGVPHDQVRQAK